MTRTLGGFVKDRREELGLNQTELASRAEIPRTTINRIETGTTQLPSPDVRRRLATALGVSHLDLLVAAGEITEDEIGSTGSQGVVVRSADDPLTKCHAILDRLEPRRIPHTLRQLELIEESRQTRW